MGSEFLATALRLKHTELSTARGLICFFAERLLPPDNVLTNEPLLFFCTGLLGRQVLLLTFHFVLVFVLNEILGGIFGFYRFC
jgi:hypothetical protein